MITNTKNHTLPTAPISQLAPAIKSGALSSEQLVEQCLAAIARSDEQLSAWVSVYAEEALTAAREAEQKRATTNGGALPPLHGIPIAIKDIIDIEGRITTGGSPGWRERVSPVTATLVHQLRRAGMIVLGKTHSVEFAMGGWGTNTGMGTPWNPWDRMTHRAPGGSSSGSGVAVAAGHVPCAIGTDTGGSVRIPSAWNGLTGLKTTIGRVSCHGVLPLATTLDTPGPMGRSAYDVALLLEALQGRDPLDRLTWSHTDVEALTYIDTGVKGLRLARLEAHELDGISVSMDNAYEEALAVLKALGATIITLPIPHSLEHLGNLVGHIIGIEGYSAVGELVDKPDSMVDPDVRPRIRLGRGVTATKYLHLLRQRAAITETFNAAMKHQGVDALLTPAMESIAPPITAIDQQSTPARFTRFVNFLDWCALVVPCGQGAADQDKTNQSDIKLPLALQIACGYGREDLALRIGHAFQKATHWHQELPRSA